MITQNDWNRSRLLIRTVIHFVLHAGRFPTRRLNVDRTVVVMKFSCYPFLFVTVDLLHTPGTERNTDQTTIGSE